MLLLRLSGLLNRLPRILALILFDFGFRSSDGLSGNYSGPEVGFWEICADGPFFVGISAARCSPSPFLG
jgi:hypothetical protein